MSDLLPKLRDRQVQGAVKNLIIYSLTIIAVPLASMFFLKQYFFQGFLGYDHQDSVLYAAVCAVVLVHVVLALWVFTAAGDQKPAKQEKNE